MPFVVVVVLIYLCQGKLCLDGCCCLFLHCFFFFWVQLYLFMSQLGVFRYCFFKRCDMNAFVSFA
ncbi:hypothetical protein BDE02_02G082000 [Populus trichocarpa]|nr:hypothetical protein BDE02_02G082000 [Populus trichocarpa]